MVFKLTVTLVVVCCTMVAVTTAASIYDEQVYLALFDDGIVELAPLSRHARSPKDGSVSIDIRKDPSGRYAGAEYKQNLYKGDKGRLSVDAYGRAERDFDRHRNNFGGGVQTSWKF